MNKVVNIRTIILYTEVVEDNPEHYYFLDLNSYEILSRKDLVEELGYEEDALNDEVTLEYSSSLLPVLKINVVEKMKEFLVIEHEKEFLKSISDLDNNEMYIAFDVRCERDTFLEMHWCEYIEKVEIEEAIRWCNEHNLKYEL